jgi:hypothetical protein
MMSLAHAYVAKEVTGSEEPLLIYGSIFPDIHMLGLKEARTIHKESLSFRKFIKSKYPELMQFAIGVCLHCEESRGLDYFAHIKYKNAVGYCNIPDKELAGCIKSTFGVLKPELYHALYHVSREFAVDLLLKTGSLANLVKDATRNVPVNQISAAVADYLNLDSEYVAEQITKLNKVFLEKPYDMNLMVFIANDLCKRSLSRTLDEAKLKHVFNKAMAIVRKDCREFVDYAISKMSAEN